MTFKGINHMAMVTGDMEKTTIFYRDALGMPLVGTFGNVPGRYPYRHYFFEVGDGNTIAFPSGRAWWRSSTSPQALLWVVASSSTTFPSTLRTRRRC